MRMAKRSQQSPKLPDDHVEIHLVVGQVGLVPAQVPGHPGGAQQRAGDPEADGDVGVDGADALGALLEDGLAGEQVVVLVHALGDGFADGQDIVAPPVGQVGRHTAGAEVVVVHPQPGDLLEEAEQHLPLPPSVDEHVDGADVRAAGGEEEHVGADPVELAHEHPDPGGPGWDLDAEQPLHRQAVGQLVEERGEVVHPGDVGAPLVVHQLFAGLLHPGVEVADDRLGPQDRARRRARA